MTLDVIGFFGMSLILFAFIMNQIKKWHEDDLIYDIFNAVGGVIMVVYAYLIKGYPFLVLNFIWAIVSIRDVIIGLKKL
ncbi:hypothetical protein HN789_02580 [archaeon]|jgi:hypothetical protein|nr:hypothetical protein [archaeon]MBT4021943.1 hypothetical protein [archaeon]MBT4272260.1 hypothetical protein [archaeon]MBT4460796.1 hypothetical protein [archaeon]MBT4858364.1 hypothetical protein [archaeon]